MGPLCIFLCVLLSISSVQSQIVLTQSGPEMKKLGESVRLECEGAGFTVSSTWMSWIRQAPGKGLEWLVWYYDSNSKYYNSAIQDRFTASKGGSKLYLQMNSLRAEDSGVYYCGRGRTGSGYAGYFDYWGQGTTVTVTTAQSTKPSVFPLVPCCRNKSESNIPIGCLATGFLPQPVEVTWKAGSTITSGVKTFPAVLQSKTGLFSQSSSLSVPASDWQTKTYQCLVKHTPTSSEVTTTVKHTDCKSTSTSTSTSTASKPTVRVLQSSCKDNSDKEVIELVCFISGFSPDSIQVQWLVNGEPKPLISYTAPSQKDHQEMFSTSSRLNVSKSDWLHKDIYTCNVEHPASNSTSKDSIRNCIEFSNPMQPMVSLIGPSVKDLYINKEVSIKCLVTKMETEDDLSIRWEREKGKPVSGHTKEPEYDESSGTYTAESILKITPEDWTNRVVFTCIVNHPDFSSPVKRKISKPNVSGSAPTVYVFPPHKQELAQHDFISLTCLAKGFKPKDIYLQWEHNGSVVSGKNSLSSEPVLESSGTYFLYSRLIIQKSHWESRNTFTCTAVHSALPLNNMMKRDIQNTKRR